MLPSILPAEYQLVILQKNREPVNFKACHRTNEILRTY
jgi:hypothetical protein